MIESSIFYQTNRGFERVELPAMAQLAPVYAIEAVDLNKDGWTDLIIGGNQYNVKPQFGRYDALNVTILFGTESGFTNEHIEVTNIEGQVRDIKYFDSDKFLFFINNDSLQVRSVH